LISGISSGPNSKLDWSQHAITDQETPEEDEEEEASQDAEEDPLAAQAARQVMPAGFPV
jgi:hypothetical protein